ncbi:hypothetical protein GCM10011351_00250 [Paraliobacillus quinghaiensis]|uniref:CXXC-20-CXXC protein n=1 Tax=Paraliobacillus quinghaiensis TaxID=470815 RepID=A0A917TD06_9BACI|nr:hypothetical protein GCM10011351_00250 [Paraliobacillus quinghaiensis]
MQKCKDCNEKFSWSTVYRSVWKGRDDLIICETCGARHRSNIRNRFVNTFLVILPMIIFMNYFSPSDNFLVTIALGIVVGFFGSLLTPFLYTYRVDNENT